MNNNNNQKIKDICLSLNSNQLRWIIIEILEFYLVSPHKIASDAYNLKTLLIEVKKYMNKEVTYKEFYKTKVTLTIKSFFDWGIYYLSNVIDDPFTTVNETITKSVLHNTLNSILNISFFNR